MKKIGCGSAVVIFANEDDAVDFVGFLSALSVLYGVESPLDLSCFILK